MAKKPRKAKKFKFDGYVENSGLPDYPKFKMDNDQEAESIISIDELEMKLWEKYEKNLIECFQDNFVVYDDGEDHSTWVCVRGRCWKVG